MAELDQQIIAQHAQHAQHVAQHVVDNSDDPPRECWESVSSLRETACPSPGTRLESRTTRARGQRCLRRTRARFRPGT